MNSLDGGKLIFMLETGHELTASKTQVQFANEGAEKKQKEEEVAARKRKLEEKEKWEGESLSTLCFFIREAKSYGFSRR